MTQEEKAKAYDEALEAVKNLREINPSDEGIQNWVNENFPELKESEGEKIRKVLIGWINHEPSTSFNDTFDGFSKEQILAWLEKQCTKTTDCSQNHQDSNHPNGCIVLEDFNGGEGFYKVHLDYLSKKQVEEVEEMVRAWALDKGIDLSKELGLKTA